MRFSAGDPRVNWKFPLAFGVAGASVAFLWASSRANAPPGPAPPPRPGPPATPPAPLPSPLCPPQGARVAVVGDSFAEGLGPHLAAHAKDCGTPFFLDDARGTSVTQWTGPRLDAALAFNPSVVLVSLGGNDFGRGDPLNVQSSIGKLAARVRASGARLLWIAPVSLPFPDKTQTRATWLATVGGDFYPSENDTYPRAADRIHLFPSGYRDWASKVWRWMSERVSR